MKRKRPPAKPRQAKPRRAKQPNLWSETKAIQRDARRDAILQAATRCINQRGYSGASMARIAKELGLSYNALYHYFDSKEEILAQAFFRAHRLIRESVARSTNVAPDGRARLLAFVADFQRGVQEESPPAAALSAHLPEGELGRLVASRDHIVGSLVAIVDAGMEDGSIRRGDSATIVAFLLGALEGMPYWLFAPDVVASSFREIADRLMS